MNYIFHIKNSLQKSKTMLDLGCGKGFFSILAASYGAKVVAIDEQSMTQKFKISPYMIEHPNITYREGDLKNHEIYNTHTYDTIILRHVIMFLKSEYVINNLLPLLYTILNKQGTLYFTFFAEDDVIQNSGNKRISHCYTTEEIYQMFPKATIIEEKINDNDKYHHIFHVFVTKA